MAEVIVDGYAFFSDLNSGEKVIFTVGQLVLLPEIFKIVEFI